MRYINLHLHYIYITLLYTDGETDGHRPTAKTARLYAYRRAVKITQVIGRLVHTSHHHEFTAECTVHERAGIQQDVRA